MNPPSIDTINAALSCIPADLPRDEWARVAMALKAELGEPGLELFDQWSARGDKYNAADVRSTWRSVKAGGRVKTGTLFHLAKAHGFRFDEAPAPAAPLTAAQRAEEAKARRDSERREREAQQARQGAAAQRARAMWEGASETGQSGYLKRKGVQGHGVRFARGGVLLVPMRDAAGELWNVQACYAQPLKAKGTEGPGPDKLYRAGEGGRKSGLWHLLGEVAAPVSEGGAPVVLVAEGYATGASLHEATGHAVAVAFDAGNLLHVARALHKLHPAALLLLCADNDTQTEAATGRNPGRDAATRAAAEVGGLCTWPDALPEGGSDFNDMHHHAGLEAVRRHIEQALSLALDASGVKQGAAPEPASGASSATPAADKPSRPSRGRGRSPAPADDDSEGDKPAARDRFRVDELGLWFDPPGDDGGGARRVCGPLRVTALARDPHDNGAALLLEFDAPYRKGRQWLMPLTMLAGDGAAYRAELLNQGFMAPTDRNRRAWLTDYLQSRRPSELVRIVDRVGWHGRAYVLPRETLGDSDGERILFQSDAPIEATFSQRGTLDKWQALIGRHCDGNSRMAFAASIAFAGPLLAWAPGTDGGGFHLVGNSSCGKTTALRVAASVWGGRDYLQRWRATDNGLEAMAAQFSDALLCLDEIQQMDAKVAGESAYMLANGQGKSRAGRTGAARPRLTWRLLFLSAGEIGLADHMAEAGKRTRAGQELRMIDLPASAGKSAGVFDTCGEFEGGGALSQHLTRACESVYGTPGRAWLEWLTEHTEGLSRSLRERMDAIAAAMVPDVAAGQVQRVGRRFALVAAAGELATEAGITGWPAGTATEAARRCFVSWTEARTGGLGLSEDAQMLRQVRQWFATYGEMNFKRWGVTDSDHAPATPMMYGWRKPVHGDEHNSADELVRVETGRVWYVLADAFRTQACKGFGHRACLDVLKARGLLELEPSGRALHRAKPPGESASGADVYRVKSAILATGDD
jgi:putative DNA primase/helicase